MVNKLKNIDPPQKSAREVATEFLFFHISGIIENRKNVPAHMQTVE